MSEAEPVTNQQPLFPVVGVGASAGGLRALEYFFETMPAAPGMAFIVLMHLAPDKHSLLKEILSRLTKMSVTVAQDGLVVEKNNVYVLPPNATLAIAGGTLKLHVTDALRHERAPIDAFFASLARDRGNYAVGVVLSGNGADGVLGVKAIKEAGGFTLAQTRDSSGPDFSGMPDSAIASGMVDFAISVRSMPDRLAKIFHAPDGAGDLAARSEESEEEAVAEGARAAICALLIRKTGHDFSGYKTGTFMRRVHRRLKMHQCANVANYIQLLESDSHEATQLFHDLIINVTDFFRDREAFEALRQTVIPHLFEGKGASDWVRVWTPGCSTGEEAISIAILLREYMDGLPSPPRVTVFATDIDENALAKARAGRYPEQLLRHVSPERRDRFFIAYPGGYVVAPVVRDICVFSPHNILRDPPFSRMDMISCRNLLIYFDAEAQRRAFPLFHYALRPGGFLFLGLSETIGRFSDLFAPFDNVKCVYRASEASRTTRLPLSVSGLPLAPFAGRPSDAASAKGALQLREVVESRVARLTPPHVVVAADGEILYASARTGKYLELAPGAPNRQLLTMAHKDLRLDLRGALREALQTGQITERANVRFETENQGFDYVSLRVEPLPERTGDVPELLIVFRECAPGAGEAAPGCAHLPAPEANRIDAELRDARKQLHTTIEEYEIALDELRSANEQMMSLNEELQSSNEELESSKEELQSVNEEMQTVNQEILNKVQDLDRANADLSNVFVSVRIAAIFLDRHLAIRSFTPPSAQLFNLISTDVGRPLTHLTTTLDYPGLEDDLRKVLDGGGPVELSVRNKDADPRYYLIRLTPDCDSAGAVNGVVATFIDAPSLSRAEQSIERLFAERLKAMQAMAAGLAHEINQPLAAIVMYLEALRRQAAAKPDARPASLETLLDKVIGQSLQAGRIIHNLREFISQNEPNTTIFSLHDLIRETVDQFKAVAQSDAPLLTLALNAENDRAVADRTQINQVLVNLMKNGQEAMEGSSQRELTIRTSRIEDDMVRIDVADTGAGLDSAVQSRLFEPFLSTKMRGMGIGLPISRKIIEAHSGKLWASPNPCGGAVFSFTLPLAAHVSSEIVA